MAGKMKKGLKVMEILTAHPELSLNEVAERAGCTHEYARLLRKKMAHVEPLPAEESPLSDDFQRILDDWIAEDEPTLESTFADLSADLDESVDAIIDARGSHYGKFVNLAFISQRLKAVMADTPNWLILSEDMVESLEMVAHKMARILNGDPTHKDSWVDIAGYAQLVADRLDGKER